MSENRYVTVPEDITITLKDQDGKTKLAPLPFSQFVEERSADGAVFGASLDGIFSGLSIRQAFEGKKAGDVVELPFPRWEQLCKAIRSPQGGYNVGVMVQLLPYAEAVIDAPSKRQGKRAR